MQHRPTTREEASVCSRWRNAMRLWHRRRLPTRYTSAKACCRHLSTMRRPCPDPGLRPEPDAAWICQRANTRAGELAVTSRAMPLFRYDPTGRRRVRVPHHLDGNPGRAKTTGLQSNADEERALTPADWAMGQDDSLQFEPLANDAQRHRSRCTSGCSWTQRVAKGKTPFVADWHRRRRTLTR